MANPNNALKALRNRKTSTVEQIMCIDYAELTATMKAMKDKYPSPRYTVRSTTQVVKSGRGVTRTRSRVHWVRVYER